jgi:putative peptide zinc metalloprotease protein
VDSRQVSDSLGRRDDRMSTSAPCLRSDLSIIPQVYRGETSFVVKDLSAQKYFRFGAIEVRVMRCFDGQSTPAEIAASLAAEGVRISVQAVEAFARKMAGAGFLERSVEERSTLQLERLRAERTKRRRPRLFRGELLRMRWSFGDPDALLTRTLPHLRWMFGRPFVIASAALFVLYLGLLANRWNEFVAALGATYSLHNITVADVVTLWLVGGVVILVHELGHGYACKYFGGDVRELGFMLIYFQPAFYCNVSDAWSFPDRRARLWVTAAGGWIQLVIASLAAVVWWAAAPGTLVAKVALAAMLVGGVTTLFTNANPLLPLDGYFALTDWLEIPNLRHRAFAHFQWWIKRRVLRAEVPEPAASARERRVFLLYGALAFVYATALFVFLAALLLGWASRVLGTLGVLLILGVLFVLLRTRIVQWVRVISLAVRARATSRRTLGRRVVLGALIFVVLLLIIPWTISSPGTFVVRPLSTRTVSAADSGVIAQVFVAEGARVDAGAPLVRLVNRELDRDMLAAVRAIDSLTLLESAVRSTSRIGIAARLAAERSAAIATFAALQRRASDLTVRATFAGVVATARPEDLAGRRVSGGDSLLVLAVLDSVELRIALDGAGAIRVRSGQAVHAISFADLATPWTSRVTDVSAIGVARTNGSGPLEVRVRRTAGDAWRPGTAGEASVELARSNVFGALWWKARQLVRADLWL